MDQPRRYFSGALTNTEVILVTVFISLLVTAIVCIIFVFYQKRYLRSQKLQSVDPNTENSVPVEQ